MHRAEDALQDLAVVIERRIVRDEEAAAVEEQATRESTSADDACRVRDVTELWPRLTQVDGARLALPEEVALLRKLGSELGFLVHGLAAVSLDGKAISSTRIRERIVHGDFDSAGQMLGRAYSISSRVVEGDKLGRTIGFPTANLDIAGLVLPPCGVYAATAQVEGEVRHAVLNIGRRPTLAHPRILQIHAGGEFVGR